MPQPLFSILTTAYRTEDYVAQTIESVLAQTFDDWELIVVDNGNSDEMADIVDKYTGDSRVTLVRQANSGVRGGVAAAADVAVGRYLCLLDSDDMLEPNFCERIAAVIEADPEVQAVGCDAELFTDFDVLPPERYFHSVGRTTVPDTLSLSDMLDEGVPPYIGAVRRDVWAAHAMYDPRGADVEPDVEMWLSLAAGRRNIRLLGDCLARIRLRPDSMTHEPSAVEGYESRLARAFISVGEQLELSDADATEYPALQRIRYHQALRRVRWAVLEGDVASARIAAREAYRQRATLRAAAVIIGLHISPRLLRSVHPAKNRVEIALRRIRYRLASGHTR
jgi:glycosyltransferase involved in cell wall biosynthesis